MKDIITASTVDGVSDPITLTGQITFVALGLEETDTVDFWLLLPSKPVRTGGQVTLPVPAAEVQIKIGDDPIQLTPDRPFVVMDAPQGFLIRAKLHVTGPASTQIVKMEENTTTAINDRLRGGA